MRTTPTRRTLLALTTGLALTLTACGGSDSTHGGTSHGGAASTSTASSAAPGTGGISAEHNDADVTFIDEMHPHHQGAVDMAELAATRAASQQVKDLAARIAAAQGPEMTRMEDMAEAWDVELGAASSHGEGHGGGMSMGDGLSADATALEELTGAAFDRQFLTAMTAHHQSALPMARVELEAGSNPQAKAMAQGIVTSQTAEIDEMKRLLTQL